mmetsp:Transcript_24087/g.51991  ORF Transcript_24087/g.51991 Transcript_24087/m.51991 type:complete len:309 (+) Transcript_24087:142-1068(+)
MASVLQFRRQPTESAKIGVVLFSTYALYLIYKYDHQFSVTTSILILLVVALISAFFLFVAPISQPQAYHNFSDKRQFLCSCHAATVGFFLPPGTEMRRNSGFIIPHFGDVISNIIIFVGGVFGLVLLHFDSTEVGLEPAREWQLHVCLPVFFSSTVAISAGSTYYHWNPNDSSLVWDRLPMTLAFVSIFCFMLEEYLPTMGIGQSLMPYLLMLGMCSVLYWRWMDDLRLYALVQFLPLIVIAALLVCCQSRHGGTIQQASALVCYGLAKASEERDYEIFSWTNKRISGHSLKHVLAGLASISIASMLL